MNISENKINNNQINHESRIASSEHTESLVESGIGLRLQVVLNPSQG